MTRSEDSYESFGYYCWLIPCCISFLLSLSVLFISLQKKTSLMSILNRIFVIGDLLQCIALFPGPIYTLEKNESELCEIQEVLFEIGLRTKITVVILVSGMFLTYGLFREQFNWKSIKIFFYIVLTVSTSTLILSFVLQSWKAACSGILTHKWNSLDKYDITYLIFFLLPSVIYAYMSLIFSSIGLYYRRDDLSSALLTPIYDRLYFYLFLIALGLFPSTIYFIFLTIGRMNIILHSITGIILSSTGTVFSVYYLFEPCVEKSKRLNLFFFIEKLDVTLYSSNIEGNSGIDSLYQESSSVYLEF